MMKRIWVKEVVRMISLLMALSINAGLNAEKSSTASIPNTVSVESRVISFVAADLDVNTDRVSRTMKWFSGFLTPENLEQRKDRLLEELKQSCGADVIIDPQFEYSPKILGGGRLSVSGYPARYVNFRNLTPTEIDSLILSGNPRPERVIFYENTLLP